MSLCLMSVRCCLFFCGEIWKHVFRLFVVSFIFHGFCWAFVWLQWPMLLFSSAVLLFVFCGGGKVKMMSVNIHRGLGVFFLLIRVVNNFATLWMCLWLCFCNGVIYGLDLKKKRFGGCINASVLLIHTFAKKWRHKCHCFFISFGGFARLCMYSICRTCVVSCFQTYSYSKTLLLMYC